MSPLLICASLIALAGCATQVEIAGPYANHLSHADIHQITALIVESEMYSHGYARLEAVRPDKVLVKYVGYGRSIDRRSVSDAGSAYFIAFKRNGKWIEGGEFSGNSEAKVTVH